MLRISENTETSNPKIVSDIRPSTAKPIASFTFPNNNRPLTAINTKIEFINPKNFLTCTNKFIQSESVQTYTPRPIKLKYFFLKIIS